MNQMSIETNHNNDKNNKRDQVEWRRNKVQELLAKGNNNHYEIASILQVSRPTISRDIEYLRQQARTNIRRYIDETLPEEYEKCLTGLTAILREAWNTAQNSEDRREKIQALSLAKECYSMKLELLTNATVVDDAMKFVEQSKGQVKSISIPTHNNRFDLPSNNENNDAKEQDNNGHSHSDYRDNCKEVNEEEREEKDVTNSICNNGNEQYRQQLDKRTTINQVF
jgi:hypothetical protein